MPVNLTHLCSALTFWFETLRVSAVGAGISCLPPIIVLLFAVISTVWIVSPEEEKRLKSKKPILRKQIQERTLNECRNFEWYLQSSALRHFKLQYEEVPYSAIQLFVVSTI
jgi:hypothetical protein